MFGLEAMLTPRWSLRSLDIPRLDIVPVQAYQCQ
jgi:hypothetical protein